MVDDLRFVYSFLCIRVIESLTDIIHNGEMAMILF